MIAIQTNMYLCISGNIGTGKTTLTRALQDHWGWHGVYEQIADHPYLHDFYLDMSKWSFHNQIHFLIESLKLQVDLQQISGKSICQDYSLYERQLYTELLHDQGLMSTRDYNTCHFLFSELLRVGRQPDCIIYLAASADKLMDRIRSRKREAEENMDISFLRMLEKRYELMFQSNIGVRVAKFNTETYDFRETKSVEALLREMKTGSGNSVSNQ